MSNQTVEPVPLAEKFAQFLDRWNPRIVARYNGNEVRLVRIEGEFVWHSHARTDELFLVIKGAFDMDLPDRTVSLSEGDLIVVPRGTEHRPRASSECLLLVMDAEGEPNTGATLSELTRSSLATL